MDVAWSVTGVDPQAVTATLNGAPVDPPLHLDQPGTYTLHLTVALCGGVSERALTFHVVDLAQRSGVPGPAGAVALLDGGAAGGADLEHWLQAQGVAVARYDAPCQALRDLRGGQLSAVVLYLPPGARPPSFAACLPGTDPEETAVLVCPSHLAPCQQAPWELSAAVFRRSGLLVLGDLPPTLACLLPDLQAPGAAGGLDVYRRIGVEGTGAVVTPPAGLDLHDVRALQLTGAAAALLSAWPGERTTLQCTGVRTASLRVEPPFAIDGRTLTITARSPLVTLDQEEGRLDPGGDRALDQQAGPWASLRVTRPDRALVVDLASVDGGPLPRWVEIAVETIDDRGRPTRFAATVDLGCGVRADATRHPVAVLSLEWIAKTPEQLVLGTVRRYGRGQAAVAPFDLAGAANAAAAPVVAEMLHFVLPDEPWPVLPGMPVPVEIRVDNRAPVDVPVRITVDVDPGLLLGGPGEPPPGAPPFYAEAVPALGHTTHTFWVRLPEDGTTVTIPIHFEVNTAAGWRTFSQPTVTLTPESEPRAAALGVVRRDLVHLRGLPTTTAALVAVVDRTLPELDSLVGLPDEPGALDCTLVVLRRAFARLTPFDLPEVEAARDRLARLLSMVARKQMEVTP